VVGAASRSAARARTAAGSAMNFSWHFGLQNQYVWPACSALPPFASPTLTVIPHTGSLVVSTGTGSAATSMAAEPYPTSAYPPRSARFRSLLRGQPCAQVTDAAEHRERDERPLEQDTAEIADAECEANRLKRLFAHVVADLVDGRLDRLLRRLDDVTRRAGVGLIVFRRLLLVAGLSRRLRHGAIKKHD